MADSHILLFISSPFITQILARYKSDGKSYMVYRFFKFYFLNQNPCILNAKRNDPFCGSKTLALNYSGARKRFELRC